MLDAPHFWDHKPMDHHMYKDPVQVVVRTILARSFIMFFNTFEYIQDPLTQLFGAQFPKQHEQMIVDCIAIMDNECMYYITN